MNQSRPLEGQFTCSHRYDSRGDDGSAEVDTIAKRTRHRIQRSQKNNSVENAKKSAANHHHNCSQPNPLRTAKEKVWIIVECPNTKHRNGMREADNRSNSWTSRKEWKGWGNRIGHRFARSRGWGFVRVVSQLIAVEQRKFFTTPLLSEANKRRNCNQFTKKNSRCQRGGVRGVANQNATPERTSRQTK